MSRILVSAGDYSADLHGASLIKEMRLLDPSLEVTALGGVKLKSVSNEFLQDMVGLDVSGFTRPVKQFFNLKRILLEDVFPRLRPSRTDAVILIDYYGFNIHVARKAKENNIPVFYFVGPQVWASRQWRIQKLKECVTKMLVIFPFEEELYKKYQVPVEFVGHPMIDVLPSVPEKNFNGDLAGGNIRLGLMPGSRQREIVRHIPLMVKSFRKLKEKFPNIEGTLFAVDSISDDYYRSFEGIGLFKIVRENNYAIRSGSTLCLTASGTATLENALMGIPMVVVYQTSWLTYLVVKNIIQLPFISMPNILSGKAVVPELIQHRATPDSVTRSVEHFLSNPSELKKMNDELLALKKLLGRPGAYQRAAKTILDSIV